jgi:tetratricopeptide (TPR) repeat protein
MIALMHRAIPDAERALNLALQQEPDNLIVQMCLGRMHLQSKRPDLALRAYQKVLQVSPNFSPDPRVGIGLGYWLSGDHRRAQMAWKRALKRVCTVLSVYRPVLTVTLQDANNHGARLLLNVADANEAKSASSSMSSEERQEKLIAATRQMGQLFVQTHQKLSPVALSLIRNTEVQGQLDKVSHPRGTIGCR